MEIEVPSGVGSLGLYFGGIEIGGKLLVDSNVTPANAPSIMTTACSVGTKQGFSITMQVADVSSAAMSVAHGLTQKPEFILGKCIDGAGATNISVYHTSYGADYRFEFNNGTAAVDNAAAWNDTEPTSSLIYTVSGGWMYPSPATFMLYAWHSVPGLQKFGKYEGFNSSDGPFIELGFRPALMMFKDIDAAQNWIIIDDKRSPYNLVLARLFPNSDLILSGLSRPGNSTSILSFPLLSILGSLVPISSTLLLTISMAWFCDEDLS